jgi:hypothetical protein
MLKECGAGTCCQSGPGSNMDINDKPRDVVSAPSVSAGTTHEVHLRKKKEKNLVMWSQHHQLVLVPLTRSAYDTKKKS